QKSFEIIIQLGAILAVVSLYWKDFLNPEILKKLFVAFLPTAAVGFALYSFIKTYLIGNPVIVVWALALGGIALIVFELLHREKEDATTAVKDMSYKQAALVGLAQATAVVPGVSRSASTILGGLMLGLKRTTIVEFSFLLAVPTMLAATALDVMKVGSSFSVDQVGLLAAGFVASFVVAILAIKFLLTFVRSHTFIGFGVYRIALAALFFLFIL
ncbi:MAG: undecaprenyl-diphosphate phosphatase, partial [Patescibacteria group bacterium]|nr:undecaprenyl-diphosphate phosphatase [Patescibacteria group bacterium]